MLHPITEPIRKRQLFAISMTTSAVVMALIFVVTPAFAQDDGTGVPAPPQPEQPAALTAKTEGATVPRLVTFSGVLKDAGGKPVMGTVRVAFSVYEFQEGGSPLWVETQAVRADAQGRYTVLLGATQPDGLPLDLFTTGRARWLGVQPVASGDATAAEEPRVLLAGVPYALKAADADTLGGKPASAYLTTETLGAPEDVVPASATTTSAGVQALSPTLATSQGHRKASSTGPLATSCANVTADGTAKANFVAKFTAACVIHQSTIFESSGNVGIGNTSPAGKLDVSGNTFTRGTFNLNQTTSPSVGVINMGSNPFIHACCSSSADNTFVGVNAGNFTTTGSANNTAIGEFALHSNGFGSENTASGVQALQANSSGGNNTAAGYLALNLNTLGSDNTADGDSALRENTTGFRNTAIGESALVTNVTGSNNTALGDDADVTANNLTNATAIGAFATVSESNALVLGCTNCQFGTSPPNVGIGTATPSATLDVVAPNQAGLFVRGPESGLGAGLDFLTTGTGGLQWEILNTGAAAPEGANKLKIRNINAGINVFTITANGQVGIETTAPDNTLTVNGSADKPGGGSWGTYSDGRLKTVAGTYEAGLDAILKLTPVRYRYKEQNAMGIKDGQEHIGFVAQEVEKVIPEAVSRNNRGYLLVNNDPILWTMLNAIKQQQAEIEVLARSAHEKDAQIQKLTQQARELRKIERQMAALKGRLAEVEAKNSNSPADATLVAYRLTR